MTLIGAHMRPYVYRWTMLGIVLVHLETRDDIVRAFRHYYTACCVHECISCNGVWQQHVNDSHAFSAFHYSTNRSVRKD